MNNNISELSNFLSQFMESMDNEINFFIEQIKNNLENISAYERFCNENKDYIDSNPEKQYEFFSFAYNQYYSVFPYIVFNSLLITFDSYFENKFTLLTEKVSISILNEFKLGKKNKSIIEMCFSHLKNKLGIQIPEKNENWTSIKNYHKIRNLIVHYNSSLSKNSSFNLPLEDILKIKEHKDYYLIKGNKYIDLKELSGKFYIIDIQLIVDYLNDIRAFMKKVIEQFRNTQIS
jgi:hypothetical protein